ncbi:MFS transporter [Spartinivicinus ruber]|uniref:MFS transporter n=1 Tax=Spartinivicinus ruber TaxID=2683272 RepID=UPI0013D63903|nr:MFS transporter [Spartinivicinus ruber]
MTQPTLSPPSERTIVLLMALVQFINLVDFMVVMPLGPDFAQDLGIPANQAGFIGGVYTFSAALMALLLASKLDRFDRRNALVFCMGGLSVATLAATLANGLTGLLIARIVAGLFGGLASSLAMAVVVDQVPPKNRGKAMAMVMGAFPAASVIGVPLGLQLAHWYNWQAPFLLIGSAGLLVVAITWVILPKQNNHKANQAEPFKLTMALTNPTMLQGLALTGFAIFSSFLIIPHFATYFLFNLDYPRDSLGTLYMVGGIVTYIVMQITGWLVDKWGPIILGWVAAIGISSSILAGFLPNLWWPVLVVFSGFMGCNSIRNVTVQTVTSKIPPPSQRAGFMATQSAIRHTFSGIGVAVSTLVLSQNASGQLENMATVAWIAVTTTALLPIQIQLLHNHLTRRDKEVKASQPVTT